MYEYYLSRQEDILADIDLRMKRDKKFEDYYKDFEGQKVCYLPLNTFILKPAHRLLHYKLILERECILLVFMKILHVAELFYLGVLPLYFSYLVVLFCQFSVSSQILNSASVYIVGFLSHLERT